jgi:hypothetical protein
MPISVRMLPILDRLLVCYEVVSVIMYSSIVVIVVLVCVLVGVLLVDLYYRMYIKYLLGYVN